MTGKRPNILLITSDQHRGDCFGFAGRNVKTPHLDAMARAGTRFSTCITANPICQPSRASILTGLYPRTHGVRDNGIDLDETIGGNGFGGQLTRAGYRTGFIGKAHFSTVRAFAPTGRPENDASASRYGDDWFGPYMGFEHVELIMMGHYGTFPPPAPPGGCHYERWLHADGRGAEKVRLHQQRLAPDVGAVQTWHSALPAAWHNSTWVGNQTINYIEEHKDEPFCVWASFADPHTPFDAPDPWSRMHDPDEVDLPPHRTRDFDRRPWWHRASREKTPALEDEQLRNVRANYSRPPQQEDLQLRHLIANYYGMISLIDHNVGRILNRLEELGLAENTLVIFTSDHGDWLGDHGLLLKGPMLYDGLIRVGCVVSGPGVPAGQVVDDPVSLVDLAETFYDYAGVDSTTPTHGRSLRDLIEGDGDSREFAYNEWDLNASRCGVELELRTARTRRYRLTLEDISGEGELYDLQEDPFELEDRFHDPAYASVRQELTDMIRSRPDDVRSPQPAAVGMA